MLWAIKYQFTVLLLLLHATKQSAWLLVLPRRLHNSRDYSFNAKLLFSDKYRSIISNVRPSQVAYLSSTDGSSEDNNDFSTNCDEEGECEIDWDAMPGFDETEDISIDVDDSKTSTSEPDREEVDEQMKPTTTTTATMDRVAFSSPSSTTEYDDFADWDVPNNHIEKETMQEEYENSLDVSHRLQHQSQSADQLRTRLEMNWQMTEQTEECDVYKPISCGGKTCLSCNGKGSCPCRFCRGTGFIYMKLPGASVVATSPPLTSSEQIVRNREVLMFGGNLQSLLQTEPSSAFTQCVVCQQKGHEICKQCRGSGWIADWTTTNIVNTMP